MYHSYDVFHKGEGVDFRGDKAQQFLVVLGSHQSKIDVELSLLKLLEDGLE